MILTAQDRNALMEAIEVIQAVQNGQPVTPNPSVRHVLMTILQRSIQEDFLNKQATKPKGGPSNGIPHVPPLRKRKAHSRRVR